MLNDNRSGTVLMIPVGMAAREPTPAVWGPMTYGGNCKRRWKRGSQSGDSDQMEGGFGQWGLVPKLIEQDGKGLGLVESQAARKT